jgi:Flp pilus assembly protein CpaB
LARSNLSGLTSRRPFTILGIILALLVIAAFVLVAINASAGQNAGTQTVVVPTRDLAPRIPIDAASLETKSIPVGGIPNELLFHKIDDVKGMVPLVTISAGEPVTSNMIAKPGTTLGSQSAFLPIPSGYVAMTLPTSEQQGVAGYIQPDDYISVIATVDVNGKVASMTVFTNLHVIRVGPLSSETPTQGGSTTTASSLTVVVTECQAEFLTWFLTSASLRYSLESYQDYLQSGTQSKDPNCPSVASAKGVTLKQVQAAHPSLF